MAGNAAAGDLAARVVAPRRCRPAPQPKPLSARAASIVSGATRRRKSSTDQSDKDAATCRAPTGRLALSTTAAAITSSPSRSSSTVSAYPVRRASRTFP